MMIDKFYDRLFTHFTGPLYSVDLELAKKDFFEWAGIFDEDSEDFEMKMSQFGDWYLFDRKLQAHDKAPVELAEELPDFSLTDEEKELLKSLQGNRHSIFEFQKLKGNDVFVKDLFSGDKFVIKDSPVTIGFEKVQYFETRIFSVNGEPAFGKAFCFHPAEVSKFILKEIKLAKKKSSEEEPEFRKALIRRLFRMKYKHQQYRHVDIKEIYSNDSKLRV